MEKLEIYDEDTLNEIELKRQNNIIRNWEFLKLCGKNVSAKKGGFHFLSYSCLFTFPGAHCVPLSWYPKGKLVFHLHLMSLGGDDFTHSYWGMVSLVRAAV